MSEGKHGTIHNTHLLTLQIRLYVHIRRAQTVISHRNKVIEYIARKSLVCLTLTFIVNLVMNILKVTEFLGNRSDVSFDEGIVDDKSNDICLDIHCLFPSD